ncbi:DUF1194 domain-containing protein [Arenibacterium sp. CAU 1754]
MLRALCVMTGIVAGSNAMAADCRLALLLAIDVSSSVDAGEDALQRSGLAAALIAPEVQRAIFAAPQPVALAAYEWSGRYNQEVLVDWRMIDGPGALLEVAETIGRSKRSYNDFPTAMGYALGYGAQLLTRAPDCLFKTIDMAGDGENNEGFLPAQAYAEFPFDGVTVNGLVVNAADYEAEVSLIEFYQTQVLRGPGAFLEVAQGFADYERAMRRKLERELAPGAIGALTPSIRKQPG